jgi:hypothetical protein
MLDYRPVAATDYHLACAPDTPFVWSIEQMNQTTDDTGITFASATYVGTTVTVTTPYAHNLAVGDEIVVTGAQPTNLNGTYLVASVPTTTSFTYAVALTAGPWTQLDIMAQVKMTDWTPAHFMTIVSQYGPAAASDRFLVGINTTGVLEIDWAPSTVSSLNLATTSSLGFVDGTTHWVRVVLTTVGGFPTASFYKSNDVTTDHASVTWTLIETKSHATPGSLVLQDTTQPYRIGSAQRLVNVDLAGTITAVYATNNFGTAIDVVFSAAAADATSNTWTLNGNAAYAAGLVLDGVGDYALAASQGIGHVVRNFTSFFQTSWYTAGVPGVRKRWRRPTFIVDADDAYTLNVQVFTDYANLSAKREFNITNNPTTSGRPWGTSVWGVDNWGAAPDGEQDILRGSGMGRAYAVQLKVTGPLDMMWSVNAMDLRYIVQRIR